MSGFILLRMIPISSAKLFGELQLYVDLLIKSDNRIEFTLIFVYMLMFDLPMFRNVYGDLHFYNNQ